MAEKAQQQQTVYISLGEEQKIVASKLESSGNHLSTSIVIRKAVREDYLSVSALEELEFNNHRRARPDYFKALKNSYTVEEFEELLAHVCPICWLAVKDDTIVGLCFGKIENSPENLVCKSRLIAFIQDVVVLPEYRSKGIATALMDKARKQALDVGAASMELCVWKFNAEAIRLYEKMGMQVQYYRMEESLAAQNN